jgi:hypothetical protein
MAKHKKFNVVNIIKPVKSYLALGIRSDDGSNNSMLVKVTDAETVHDLMENEFQMDFDEIFLISNGKDCPEVHAHYLYPG